MNFCLILLLVVAGDISARPQQQSSSAELDNVHQIINRRDAGQPTPVGKPGDDKYKFGFGIPVQFPFPGQGFPPVPGYGYGAAGRPSYGGYGGFPYPGFGGNPYQGSSPYGGYGGPGPIYLSGQGQPVRH